MNELIQEPDRGVSKMQQDEGDLTTSATPVLDPGVSLRHELAGMRDDLQKLTQAVRALVNLQSVANQKLDSALTGQPIFGVTR